MVFSGPSVRSKVSVADKTLLFSNIHIVKQCVCFLRVHAHSDNRETQWDLQLEIDKIKIYLSASRQFGLCALRVKITSSTNAVQDQISIHPCHFIA